MDNYILIVLKYSISWERIDVKKCCVIISKSAIEMKTVIAIKIT